jgi:glycosyltransferase involved in cell wall biosynthesis
MTRVVLTIPCFNEEGRLRPEDVLALLADERISVLLVDDGSCDGTPQLLERLRTMAKPRADVYSLPTNRGKAEAVRLGLLHSLRGGAEVVGYVDADFSTPPGEVCRLVEELERHRVAVVMGCRVARLGANIERHAARHYLGRVFATVASMILGVRVYDTQCGAKLFAATGELAAALDEPFRSRWAFDVELLGRLLAGSGHAPAVAASDFLEVPLRQWRDVSGSKLGRTAMAKAALDLLLVRWRLSRRMRRGGRPANGGVERHGGGGLST